MNPKIIKPFKGDYPITLPFGVLPKNPEVLALYKRLSLKAHNGIDFALPKDTPVLSCYKGKVTLSGNYKDGYGILVKLQHKWGESLYAHLNKALVKIGQKVKQGEIIGLSGRTGYATGEHLHFAIRIKPFGRKGGYLEWRDPAPYFV